ncbi:MAG: energy transducer TonB [Verrucomicrobiales bacterium]|nr:energy transducer TonB [Verrucomicrobiales bacterium]
MKAAPVLAVMPPPSEPRPWSQRRLVLGMIALFAAQLALLFALGQRGPTPVRPPAVAPLLRLAPQDAETLVLNDPTLFALPHRAGFAGRAWLETPAANVPSPRPIEPPQWLALDPAGLGRRFVELERASRPARFQLLVTALPESAPTAGREPTPGLPTRSALVITDGLAGRRLLNPPELPAWPAADLLTNSVVRVLVHADGGVRSATLLGRSGLPDADQFALNVARAARFEPLSDAPDAAALQTGTMVFQWSTLPPTPPPGPTP